MTELLGYCNNIRTICQEDGGHSMPESMGIDMGQIVAGGEVFEPAGDAVRVHVIAIVLGEHIAGVNPTITIEKLEAELFPLVLPQ